MRYYCKYIYIRIPMLYYISAQTNTRLFGEYLNIRLFDYNFEYSNTILNIRIIVSKEICNMNM